MNLPDTLAHADHATMQTVFAKKVRIELVGLSVDFQMPVANAVRTAACRRAKVR